MRVRYKGTDKRGRIVNGQTEDTLTAGKEYVVLELYANLGYAPAFRIVNDDGLPVIRDAIHFEVVNPKCSGSWCVELWENGQLKLTPEPWRRPGFWDDYFDALTPEAKQAARELFEKVRAALEQEDREQCPPQT